MQIPRMALWAVFMKDLWAACDWVFSYTIDYSYLYISSIAQLVHKSFTTSPGETLFSLHAAAMFSNDWASSVDIVFLKKQTFFKCLF